MSGKEWKPKPVHPAWPMVGQHLFGPWMVKNNRTKYRVCVHPECTHVEEEDVKYA